MSRVSGNPESRLPGLQGFPLRSSFCPLHDTPVSQSLPILNLPVCKTITRTPHNKQQHLFNAWPNTLWNWWPLVLHIPWECCPRVNAAVQVNKGGTRPGMTSAGYCHWKLEDMLQNSHMCQFDVYCSRFRRCPRGGA
jgi:hypothetical protein